MGDCNGDLGNVLGDRGHYDPNVRGLKLIEFANFFNLCPVNLLANCSGPLETFVPIVGDTNQLSIIFFCLTVSLIKLFHVKLLKIA